MWSRDHADVEASQSRDPRSTIANILSSDLRDYLAVIKSGDFELHALVKEAGLRCPRCRSASCARPHGRRYRKRVTDLSTGDVFENLPILRIRFCAGPTRSVMPADLWRGRCTVNSVLETVMHVLRDGLGQALEWTSYAGDGEEPVSERTLRRWRELTRSRLIGSALAWLGPGLGFHWSDDREPAAQLDHLLDRLSGPVRLAFRAATGYAVIDLPIVTPDEPAAGCAAWPVPGHLLPAPPHDPPSELRPRGAWWPRSGRGPPRDG